MKKILALLLVLAMVLSLAACTPDPEGQLEGDLNNDGQIEVGTVEDVEVNEAAEHMDAAEAAAAGNWEALFVPVEVEGRAIDYANVDLTPTAEELEAMKAETVSDEEVDASFDDYADEDEF